MLIVLFSTANFLGDPQGMSWDLHYRKKLIVFFCGFSKKFLAEFCFRNRGGYFQTFQGKKRRNKLINLFQGQGVPRNMTVGEYF